MRKDKDQVRYEIDQLKKWMEIAALESIAITILAMVIFIGAPSVFPDIINPYLPSSLKILQGVVLAPLVYWLLTIIGNVFRVIKIFKLQKSLTSGKK